MWEEGELAAPESVRALLARWPERADEIEQKLTRFISMLLETNRVTNLTSDETPQLQWERHIEDTLRVAILAEEKLAEDGVPSETPAARILDVGSGGGVPGIVWAILWPAAEVRLLEATGKKARFLEEVITNLGLANAAVVEGRAEDLGHRSAHREAYDWVTARALAMLPMLAEWTVPFLKPGGRILAIKGGETAEEVATARRAFEVMGVQVDPMALPYDRSDGRRCTLLIYQKAAVTPSVYPRRNGIGSQQPL